jgi:hypothetical protein
MKRLWRVAAEEEGGEGEEEDLFFFSALSALNYEILIQLYLFLRLITLYSEYLALIYLKWKEPDTPRPYSVPGGIFLGRLRAGEEEERKQRRRKRRRRGGGRRRKRRRRRRKRKRRKGGGGAG